MTPEFDLADYLQRVLVTGLTHLAKTKPGTDARVRGCMRTVARVSVVLAMLSTQHRDTESRAGLLT